MIAKYKVRENLNIMAGADRFFTSRFFYDGAGSGKDVSYFYVQAQVDF